MKLFSRLTFICNISFVVFVLLQYIEINNRRHKIEDSVIPLPFVTGTLVVLGQLAIFVNLLFTVSILVMAVLKKPKPLPRWLVYTNIAFFVVQLFYFLY